MRLKNQYYIRRYNYSLRSVYVRVLSAMTWPIRQIGPNHFHLPRSLKLTHAAKHRYSFVTIYTTWRLVVIAQLT